MRKKYAGALLAVSSGTLGASIAALNLSKSPIAKKNPLLLGIGAIVSMLGGIIGLTQACNAVKEMQKYSGLVVEPRNLEYTQKKDTVDLNV